jgi:hypothetical protein
MLTSLTPIL